MRTPTKKQYKPRTLIPFNTGTRPHRTRKAYRRVKRVEVNEV